MLFGVNVGKVPEGGALFTLTVDHVKTGVPEIVPAVLAVRLNVLEHVFPAVELKPAVILNDNCGVPPAAINCGKVIQTFPPPVQAAYEVVPIFISTLLLQEGSPIAAVGPLVGLVANI